MDNDNLKDSSENQQGMTHDPILQPLNTTNTSQKSAQPSSPPSDPDKLTNQADPPQRSPEKEVQLQSHVIPQEEQKFKHSYNTGGPVVSKKMLLAYYILGILFNLIGLFIIVLWIVFKVDNNKSKRMISYLAGLLTIIIAILIFNRFISPKLENEILNRYPEFNYIPTELKKDYPNIDFAIGFDNTYSSLDKPPTSSKLIVSMFTSRKLNHIHRKDIGEKVCKLLEENGDEYSYVKVEQVDKIGLFIFTFDKTIGEERTCEEWVNEPAYKLPDL